MAAARGLMYNEKGTLENPELLKQLNDAFIDLETAMRASIPIKRRDTIKGYGVNKTQRGIAADAVISIARAIKGLKGW